MNEITLIGRVHRPTTYHCTEEARDLLRFVLATSTPPVISTNSIAHGGEVPEPSLHHCLAWGAAALDLHQSLSIGDRLMVKGELNYRNHKNRRGELRRFAEIKVTGYVYLRGEATITPINGKSRWSKRLPGLEIR